VIRKAEPLYGAPRGNRVMKAKRTTGESAYRILQIHVMNEHCHVPGCKNTVCVTRHPNMETRVRQCIEHVGAQKAPKKGGSKLSDLLKFGWQ
jgi:hypothetical protein